MSPEQFRLIRDLVHEACGILIRDEMQFVLERRIYPRLEVLGLGDYDAYYRYLRYDPNRRAELEAAIEALTTNETYFFREPQQLKAFSDELLPFLARKNEKLRRLRIWSAGCSTGEEAYTIAILLLESGRFDGWSVEVHGTDISRRVLAVARKGEYGPASMRAIPPEHLRRYFEPSGQKLKLRDDVRAMVSFGQMNLLDPAAAGLIPRMDVIFCRNVMIYFDLAARQRVLALFHDKLYDGGYLLLGHSENLIQVSSEFELVHLTNDLVYRRPVRTGA